MKLSYKDTQQTYDLLHRLGKGIIPGIASDSIAVQVLLKPDINQKNHQSATGAIQCN